MGFNDESHKTPLHLAAEKASSKHVEALAKRMSEVNARDDLGRTPLHSAARKGQRQEIYILEYSFYLHSYRFFFPLWVEAIFATYLNAESTVDKDVLTANHSELSKRRNSNLTFCATINSSFCLERIIKIDHDYSNR